MSSLSYFRSPIAAKQVMAILGQLICAFIIVHLAGNFIIFAGQDAFNKYAFTLESHPIFLKIAEAGLIGLFLFHILTACKLTLENWSARPVGYQAPKPIELRYFSSSMMGYTAVLILIFLIIHLLDFRYAERGPRGLYGVVVDHLSQLPYMLLYIAFMLVIGVHLFHGCHSSLLTLGIDHPKYTPILKAVCYLYAIVVTLGFAAIPLCCYFKLGGLQ